MFRKRVFVDLWSNEPVSGQSSFEEISNRSSSTDYYSKSIEQETIAPVKFNLLNTHARIIR